MVVVAQSVELQIVILAVAGSNPVDHPTFPFAAPYFFFEGRATLW